MWRDYGEDERAAPALQKLELITTPSTRVP
jgi:hypothetical protein